MPAVRGGFLLLPVALFLTAAVPGRMLAQELWTPTPTETPAIPGEPPRETATAPSTETQALDALTPDSPTPESTPSPPSEPSSTPGILDELVPGPTVSSPPPALLAEGVADIVFGSYGSSFAANVGQAPEGVQFLSQDNSVNFLFSSNAFALLLPQPPSEVSALAALTLEGTPTPAFEALDGELRPLAHPSESVVVQVEFSGANPDVKAIGQDPLTIQFGMYVGDDPGRSPDRVPLFGSISFPDLYPGIDLEFGFDDQQRMKSIFLVEPGADPATIRLRYSGADSLALDEDGNLTVSTIGGEVQESAPVGYQLKEGQRLDIPIGFLLSQNDVSFSIPEAYDPSLPLVIDPVLSYSTYLSEPQGDPVADFATDVALPSWYPPLLVRRALPPNLQPSLVGLRRRHDRFVGGAARNRGFRR